MVADGCGRLRNVQRTHPQPPDPQSETGTLVTHSGKFYNYFLSFYNRRTCKFQVFKALSRLSQLITGYGKTVPDPMGKLD